MAERRHMSIQEVWDLDYDEFLKWQYYFESEPSPTDMINLAQAHIVSTIINLFADKKVELNEALLELGSTQTIDGEDPSITASLRALRGLNQTKGGT
jgi:hypothetical protein